MRPNNTHKASPRSHRRPRLAAGALTAAAALALTACGGGGGAGAGTARAETLIIAENEPPATFDPVQANNSTVDEVVRPAYDTLVRFEDGEIVGSLATEWTVSDDGTVIEMTLRDDVTFHDGAALTAHDVVYTLDRAKRLQLGVASFIAAYDSAEAVDDTHLTIRLSRSHAPFLAALSRVYVLNSALVEENAGSDDGQQWLATNDAGSGPYRITGYTPNQEAAFERHDEYWGGFDGQPQKVVFRYLSEASTQATALRQGDIDIAMDIAPNDWASFESTGGFVVDRADTNVVLYGLFKMSGETPMEDAALREAVSYAYDYDQHLENILHGAGNRARGVLPGGMPCHDAEVLQPGYDPDRAREILEEAGIENVSITMTYLEATAEMEQAATLLQSNLAEIGVDLKLQAVTYPQYVELTAAVDDIPDLGMIYTFPAFPDPDAVLYQSFHSQFVGAGMNYGGYANPEVDELVERAQSATDEERRCADYTEAQSIIAEDHAALALSNPQYVTVLSDGVEGYAYDAAHHQTVDVYRISKG
ncbi:ABC transporter substrate-binding protein [Thermobifida halotolerans]|uniref:ABC transporter substrate-binding protein n=1 Tax=Thermobifida halotolerans TaxID=483545 RepID=A0A399G4X5_9ACTN|nr:ABC transporter substrate-binding protein [Thermobifida halotolerans]UOE20369.1 ABC transporter substrate-binding protein [Thermobifida halotolerans]